MAVQVTGSILTLELDPNSENPTSESITVPEDAELVVVFGHVFSFTSGLDLEGATFAGDAMTVAVNVASEDDQDGYSAVWALVGENTGAQTLQLSWPADHWHDAGPAVSVVFLKGVNTSDPIHDAGADFPDSDSAAAAVDTDPTDFVLAL